VPEQAAREPFGLSLIAPAIVGVDKVIQLRRQQMKRERA